MKRSEWNPKYTTEINKLAESHTEALLALYVDAFNDGMRVGMRNALVGISIAAVVGTIGLCVVWVTYLEKDQS